MVLESCGTGIGTYPSVCQRDYQQVLCHGWVGCRLRVKVFFGYSFFILVIKPIDVYGQSFGYGRNISKAWVDTKRLSFAHAGKVKHGKRADVQAIHLLGHRQADGGVGDGGPG